jgi:hypothetical protein
LKPTSCVAGDCTQLGPAHEELGAALPSVGELRTSRADPESSEKSAELLSAVCSSEPTGLGADVPTAPRLLALRL